MPNSSSTTSFPPPASWQKVAVLGVGLLGGSIAKGLKQRLPGVKVAGWGRSVERLAAAAAAGTIDSYSLQIADVAADADIVIAATPVQQIIGVLVESHAVAKPECLFTDVGSTKATIAVAAADLPMAARFCPSHPIAGSEKSGAEFADPNLFVRKTVILTPLHQTTVNARQMARSLWESLGADCMEMSPEQHDRSLATTSHMPHLVASALAAITPPELLPLTGTGWLSTTRVASGEIKLWRQIIEENCGEGLQAMHSFATIWAKIIDAMERRDFETLESILIQGKQIRDAVGNRHSSCE